jgi:hypothetical protein
LSAVGRPEYHTVVANDGPDISIGKINSEKACCLAGFRGPRLPAVCRSNDCSIEKADSCAVIFVAEVYGIKPVTRVARLLIPVATTIGCSQDYAILAYDGSDVGTNEMDSEKVYPSKRIAYPTVLPYPAVTSVSCP